MVQSAREWCRLCEWCRVQGNDADCEVSGAECKVNGA